MSGLRLREAVRALVVDPDERIVLVRFELPGEDVVGDQRVVWAPPGGGVEPGEDDIACLRRELREEIGLEAVPDVGAPVWKRTHVVSLTGRADESWDGQTERIYLLRVDAFAIRPALSAAELRAEHVHDLRWWSIAELATATGVVFAPRRLPALLARLLADGPGPAPIDVGV